MFYFGLGVCLIITGISLLFGDGRPVPGTKLPIDFGAYKHLATVLFLGAGFFLVKFGIKSIEDDNE